MKSPSGRSAHLGRLVATSGREGGAAIATAVGALATGGQRARHLLRTRYPTVAVTGDIADEIGSLTPMPGEAHPVQ